MIRESVLARTASLRRRWRLRRAEAYIADNPDLAEVIAKAEALSPSTGVSSFDYAALHRAIRALKPSAVLECGTGRSTYVIAAALRPFGGQLVSMEHNREWYDRQVDGFPAREFPNVEIRHSPSVLAEFGIFRGTRYSELPGHHFNFVFVDGPGQKGMCNLDLAFVVQSAGHPVSAFIDNRKTTVLAMRTLFGGDKVAFHESGLGIVRNAMADDLLRHPNLAAAGALLTGTRIWSDPVRFLLS